MKLPEELKRDPKFRDSPYEAIVRDCAEVGGIYEKQYKAIGREKDQTWPVDVRYFNGKEETSALIKAAILARFGLEPK